jgi:pimeloyl-ACP methyl ester carboxylesterase
LSQVEELVSYGYVVAGLEHSADALDSFESRAALWAQDILAAKREVLGSSMSDIIDSHKIGAFGHSLGGRAAAGACLLDPTILACLNQDGGDDDVQMKRPYWPIEGRDFPGAFAMLDWFDPGIDDEDLRAMGKTREQYAASRLEPAPAALSAYRAARRGAFRITMLTPGMQHTAFTDDLWSNASEDTQRARYAGYLSQVRVITLRVFELALNGSDGNSVCGTAMKETYTRCFKPTDQLAPR